MQRKSHTCLILLQQESACVEKQKLQARQAGAGLSYHLPDHVGLFTSDQGFHVMEEEHGEELGPQPLLHRASDDRGLCQGEDSEGGVDGKNGSERGNNEKKL